MTTNAPLLDPAVAALWAEAAAAGLEGYDPTVTGVAEARHRARLWHDYWGASQAARSARLWSAPGGPDGAVACLRFGPSDAPARILYCHGGGYVVNDARTHAAPALRLAQASGLEVASVDYSPAPERRFPTQVEETLAVALALADRPLLLAGDSAGAHLALVTALTARDRGAPLDLRGFVGFYGMFRYGTDGPSHAAYGDGRYGLTSTAMAWFWAQMAPTSGPRPRYLSPVDADLRDMPPCLLIGAELDCLADDTTAMATALTAAGVACTLRWARGLPHSFLPLAPRLPAAQAALEQAGAFLAACAASPP